VYYSATQDRNSITQRNTAPFLRYKEEESVKMLEKVMHRQREEFGEDVEDDDEVCKALARDEGELEIFLKMDLDRRNYEEANPPEDFNKLIPVWLKDYCMNSKGAFDSSQQLVTFDPKTLFAE
jgi:hypothetical protein